MPKTEKVSEEAIQVVCERNFGVGWQTLTPEGQETARALVGDTLQAALPALRAQIEQEVREALRAEALTSDDVVRAVEHVQQATCTEGVVEAVEELLTAAFDAVTGASS